MKKSNLVFLGVLFCASAMAQTPVNSQTQITQTRDYVSGLIQNVANNGNERFTRSRDYAVSGRALQAKITRALQDFRDSMSLLSEGAFAIQVEQYNRLVVDNSLSASSKAAALSAAKASLEGQAVLATSTFQAALRTLYSIEPSWVVVNVTSKSSRFQLEYGDGMKQRMEAQKIPSSISDRITETLETSCRSKLCYSLLLSDYSAFVNDIRYKLDAAIQVPLADGSVLNIAGLMSAIQAKRKVVFASNRPNRYIWEVDLLDTVDAISNYSYGGNYQNLPNKL